MERLPFVRKFRWKFSVSGMVLVLFWYRKQEERDWGVPFTKYRLNFCFLSSWSVALVIQTNGTENFGRFCKTREKGYASKGITFFRKISTRMNRSIWILHRISGFSKQMVSAHDFTDHNLYIACQEVSFSHGYEAVVRVACQSRRSLRYCQVGQAVNVLLRLLFTLKKL